MQKFLSYVYNPINFWMNELLLLRTIEETIFTFVSFTKKVIIKCSNKDEAQPCIKVSFGVFIIAQDSKWAPAGPWGEVSEWLVERHLRGEQVAFFRLRSECA